MPEAHAGCPALIGPNAILQLLPVLVSRLGAARTHDLLTLAQLGDVPDGSTMIPQGDAARLHQAVRVHEPLQAERLLHAAGENTGRYILAHRIPGFVQAVLKILPAALAARLLSRAIARHAWTFAGSGQFRAVTPWRFELVGNPLIAGEHADYPLCAWHRAVFLSLYRVLVSADVECTEETCGAGSVAGCCRFVLWRKQVAA